jgi:hypothetical protein
MQIKIIVPILALVLGLGNANITHEETHQAPQSLSINPTGSQLPRFESQSGGLAASKTRTLVKTSSTNGTSILGEETTKALREELKPVCGCESGHRQYREDGTLLVSDTNDSGYCQINGIHKPEAASLGMNIETLEGNIKFANFLFDREGYTPWEASRSCWDK